MTSHNQSQYPIKIKHGISNQYRHYMISRYVSTKRLFHICESCNGAAYKVLEERYWELEAVGIQNILKFLDNVCKCRTRCQ